MTTTERPDAPPDGEQHDEDAAQLAALGYRSEFSREMSLRANFALGFTYLSPVVGIYSVFALGFVAGGPPMIWSIVICGIGQLLVALVFGEVVSQYPLAGGVYPWARRLWGRRYAWITGWVYAWALLITIASVAYGAGAFAATLFDVEPSVDFTIGTALAAAFGDTGSKVVLVIVLISFFSCTLSLQAAASRMIYSYGRDDMVFASGFFGRFSRGLHIPPGALATAAAVPALVVLGSRISEDALTKIISFAALGIYIAFQLVVFAALRARLKGWRPQGAFRLGRWGLLVNVAALVYGVAAAVNLAWPRTPEVNWYDNWIVVLSTVVVVAVGLLYMIGARPWEKSTATAGDAVRGGA